MKTCLKKKIKALTLKQVSDLCKSHLHNKEGRYSCSTCKYANANEFECKLDYNHLDKYGDEYVEIRKE